MIVIGLGRMTGTSITQFITKANQQEPLTDDRLLKSEKIKQDGMNFRFFPLSRSGKLEDTAFRQKASEKSKARKRRTSDSELFNRDYNSEFGTKLMKKLVL